MHIILLGLLRGRYKKHSFQKFHVAARVKIPKQEKPGESGDDWDSVDLRTISARAEQRPEATERPEPPLDPFPRSWSSSRSSFVLPSPQRLALADPHRLGS